MTDISEADQPSYKSDDASESQDADIAPSARSDDDILKEARARLKLTEEAETEIRRNALDDLKFRAGRQWPDDIKQERERDGRPCLVINRLPQFVQQVTNDQRQNRPAIKVHPVDSAATIDTAKIIQGLIRHIESNSNAEVAYDTGFEGAATGGFGYWRVITDFIGPDSFDQEILIKRIRNPFSVFLDPYAQEPDGSDSAWGFIVDDLSPDEYRSKYPDSELASGGSDWNAIGNQTPGWVKSDGCRVAEYYCKEFKNDTLHMLSTGEAVLSKDLPSRIQAASQAGLPLEVARSRTVKVPHVCWYKINGIEILERTEWPGRFIPIVPVYGAELYVDGERILESVIRHAKDPQRMYNYWKSSETETIALAPRAPFIGAEGQFEGYEEQWKTANRRNHAYLTYKFTTVGGQAAPPPQRQTFEPAVQAITQASMMAADDLKATTGIYDAGVGAQGNEVSGIAIQNRGSQIQTSTFHFVDNLKRSLHYTGLILIDLIPHIYDTVRAARIIGDDGEQKIVTINQTHTDESGKQVLYSMDTGRYDVVVDTGPSYASKRQEAATAMMDFSRDVPQVAQSCADLIVKNMDWPGAQDMSDRLKKLLPPALQTDPKQMQVPPQAQAQMQQMQMMIKQLSDHLNETTKIIETKKLDLEHRERVELMKVQADLEINLAKLGSQSNIELLKHEVGAITARLKLLDVNQPIGAPSDFNSQQADGGNYAGFGHVGGSENLIGEESPSEPVGT